MVRRPSSLQTILPPSLEGASMSQKLPRASPDKESPTQERPQPISNLSRRNSIVKTQAPRPEKQKENASSLNASADRVEKVTAIFDFEAENDGEMTIQRGDVITLLKRIDEGWWLGRCNNAKGIFPANYVEPLVAPSINNNNVTRDPELRGDRLEHDSLTRGRSTITACTECDCEDFSANVFKPTKCNNCFHFHG